MSSRRRRRRKVSRRLLYWIGGGAAAAVLLPILIVVALIAAMDPNSFKEQLEVSLRKVLGRDLHIRGQLSVSTSLSPRLEADDVTLINMPNGSRADMVRIEHMSIDIAPRALLTGRLVISRISLIKPDILLETDRNGVGNWTYKPAIPQEDDDGARLLLVTVHVRDGRVTWRDGVSGESASVELRRVQMSAASPEAPVIASAEVLYGRQRINISAQTGPWSRILDTAARTPWGVFANFESAGAKLTITGALTRPYEMRGYSLRVDATAPDLGQLSWLLPWRLPPLHNVSATARLLDAGGEMPEITGLVMQSGFTNLDKAVPGLTLDLFRLELPRLSEPLLITAEGAYISSPLRIAATLGAPVLLLPNPPPGPFAVDVRLEAAGATFAARGAIAEPGAGKGVDIGIGARVPDLALLAPLIGQRLPVIRNLAFAGQLVEGAGGFREDLQLRNIVLTTPQLDLAGTAELTLKDGPQLRLATTSKLFDIDAAIAAWEASKPQEQDGVRRFGAGGRGLDVIIPPPMPSRGLTAIPDERLPLEWLRALNLDLRLGIDQLRAGGIAYRDVQLTSELRGGKLTIDPLSAEMAGGRGELRMSLDAGAAAPGASLALKAEGLDLKPLIASWGWPPLIVGKLDGEMQLQSSGASLHELAAGASGRMRLALSDGRLDTGKVSGVTASVFNALRAGTDRLETGESPLRCAVLGLDIAAGVATVTEAGLDAPRLIGTAFGSVNLREETLALRLRPFLRNANGLAAIPLRLDNGWRDARIVPDSLTMPKPASEGCGWVNIVVTPPPAAGGRAPAPPNRSP